jgi:hypothetical protein
MNVVSTITDWTFLNEPMSKWFVFFGALMLISWAWKGILGFID